MTQIEKVIEIFPRILKELKKEIEIGWIASVQTQFRDKDDKIFNNQKKLRSSRGRDSLSGDLALKPKVDLNVANGTLDLTWETDRPYAGIQDRGGFIKAKPTTNSRGKKTYKMAQYFWAKSYEADIKRKRELYKRIALSVEKKGGVNIKGRHYIEGALKDFEQKRLEKILQKFFIEVARVWNAN